MDVPINVPVWCADGPLGRSTALLLNPHTQEVTHVVVQETHHSIARIVPVDMISEARPHEIHLRCTHDTFHSLDVFNEMEFVPVPDSLMQHEQLGWGSTSMEAEPYTVALETEHIPPGEVALHRGAQVYAADGYVGCVDEVLVDVNNRVTHIVLREGHWWGRRDITIPVAQIVQIMDDRIELAISKHAIAALPAVPVGLARRYNARIE